MGSSTWRGRGGCEAGANAVYKLGVGTGQLQRGWKLTSQMLTLGTCSVLFVQRNLWCFPTPPQGRVLS